MILWHLVHLIVYLIILKAITLTRHMYQINNPIDALFANYVILIGVSYVFVLKI